MRIIFCDSVVDHKVVDPDYAREMAAAEAAGFSVSVISFEALEEGEILPALRHVHLGGEDEAGVYRGWMLTPAQYALLYAGLLKKDIRLINDPQAYRHCHYLPESYAKIAGHTPKSVWMEADLFLDYAEVHALLRPFGDGPVVVKDFVKSEKHSWETACFIPDAADRLHVEAVVRKFLDLRGDALNEGLVFRQFEELEFLSTHSKSGMPLTKEFRLFFAGGELVQVLDYWEEGAYGDTQPDLAEFVELAKAIESDFFTMDVAQKAAGGWMVMELGDGQVAGLPENADAVAFYRKLAAALRA